MRQTELNKKKAAATAKQRQELDARKRGDMDRTKKAAHQKQVQVRFQQEKDERTAEREQYKDKLRGLRQELLVRDLGDEARADKEAQADEYEALLQKSDAAIRALELQAARAARPAVPQQVPAAPAPVIYDDERGEEYDTDDPLVREALAQMQQNQDVEDENNGEE
jgi:hypothetical protein